VLWALLLLSSLAAVVSYMARTNAILAHREFEIAQAQAAADAAVVNTISRLSDELVSRHPAINSSENWDFDGVKTAVLVSNEAGRIDVNTADGDLLVAFLYSQGVDESEAGVMLSELRGQESGSIERGHSNRLAVTQPYLSLQTVDELRRMPTWAAQKIDCWMDSLTVYTRLPDISTADATVKGLQALKWAQAHHLGGHDWIDENVAASGAVADRSTLGEVLRIVATSSVSAEVAFTSEWVGRLTGDRRRPILTMRWQHIAAIERSPCNDTVTPTRSLATF
jgi:hypothetical protein